MARRVRLALCFPSKAMTCLVSRKCDALSVVHKTNHVSAGDALYFRELAQEAEGKLAPQGPGPRQKAQQPREVSLFVRAK